MGSCDTCAVNIKRGQNNSVTCSSCSKLFHLSCVSLKQDDIEYLNSLNKLWSCNTCVKKSKNTISVANNSTIPLTSLSTGEPDLKLIISHLDNLRMEQTKLINLVHEQNEKLNSFDNKFHEIFSQLSSIKNENNVLRNDLTAIINRVDLLESAIPKSNANQDMFAEFIDRQNRSKNIIIFNVSEQSNDNNNSDTVTISRIFDKLGTDIKPTKISRLGKPSNKSRPLKIELQAATEVYKILGLSRLLKSDQYFNDIRITSDKSPYQREFPRDLRNQLRVRISKGSTPPSHDHLPNHDQLLAKQLEKQERERMKQKEQEDFQKLQAAYGMDNKGNYNQQTMTNLQEAVSSGQLSVYDYYEKIYEIKMAESKGLDTGTSATRDLIEYIRHFSATSPNVIEVHLASPTDHYRSTYGDKGWGCGYRNMQMLMSSMLLQMDYNEHISRVWEVEKGPLPRGWMPSISRLQQHLEKSWSMGIDEPGREQLGGTVYNTKKWIGATEVVAMLTALKIKTLIFDFHKPTGSKNNHSEMFHWLYEHFSNSRKKQFVPPVYIQHDGHSRTVVGVEKLSDGTILLLVLDPSGHYDKLRTEGGMSTMAHIRKSMHTFKSKQYQLVTVRGIMTSDAEFEDCKTIRPNNRDI